MESFTLIQSVLGGMLIGLSASILILFNGKIAGISGMVGGLMQLDGANKGQNLWRFLFLFGLMTSSYVYAIFDPVPIPTISNAYISLISAGLLVGFGTRMGSGCTSGHGVCGVSRFSVRSLIATLSFMFAGFVVCYLMLHLF